MKKIHLIINGVEGCKITALAVCFNEDNEFDFTELITYKDSVTSKEILSILKIESGEVFETLIGGRPPRRR